MPQLNFLDTTMTGKQLLSIEAVSITENLADALEVGYQGFGEIACTDAAKEGISAFLKKDSLSLKNRIRFELEIDKSVDIKLHPAYMNY